ncbi:MAG: hypothetical protein AB7T74_03025 [Clostridia bacterium]
MPTPAEVEGSPSYKTQTQAIMDELAAEMQAINSDKQEPPEPVQEREIKRGRPAARDKIVSALEDAGLELALSKGEAYVRIRRHDHAENYKLRSGGFSRASRIVAHEAGIACSRNAIDEAHDLLEARAYSEGKEISVYRRSGPCRRDSRDGHGLLCDIENKLCIDPGRADWKLWLLGTGKGPELINSDDPRAPWLVRGSAFGPMPEPEDGGNLDELFNYVNVDEKDRLLILPTMLHAWRPKMAQPIIDLIGEQGSGKTGSIKSIIQIVDPSTADIGAMPRTADEFLVVASSSIVVAFDNASHLDAELSDALCVASTGGSRLTRKLYSDGDLSILTARAQIWLNGIPDVVLRGDVASRSLVVPCPVIDPERRRSESDIAASFSAAAPRILGALLRHVDATLSTSLPSVQCEKRLRPRMADFSDSGEAFCRTLGYPAGTFDELLANNQGQAIETVLEASPVAEVIMRRIRERGNISMPASALLPELTTLAGEAAHTRSWPSTPVALASAVRRIAPALRSAGFSVESGRNHSGRYLHIATMGGDRRDCHAVAPSAGEGRLLP